MGSCYGYIEVPFLAHCGVWYGQLLWVHCSSFPCTLWSMVWAAVMGTLQFLSLYTVEYGMGSYYGYIVVPFLAHCGVWYGLLLWVHYSSFPCTLWSMVWAAVMGTLQFLSLHTVEYDMGSCYGYIVVPFLAHCGVWYGQLLWVHRSSFPCTLPYF